MSDVTKEQIGTHTNKTVFFCHRQNTRDWAGIARKTVVSLLKRSKRMTSLPNQEFAKIGVKEGQGIQSSGKKLEKPT